MTSPMKRPHGELKREVMRACNLIPGVYVFPYSSGGFQLDRRFVQMGMKGVSDLIGWKIMDDGVHQTGPVRPCFVALEIKVGRDKLAPLQKAFLDQVKEAGGIGLEIRSVEEAVKALS